MNLTDINLLSVIIRVLLALLIGGLIGLEREAKNHPAGSRTYILVCEGACLAMMTNQYIVETFRTGDPARLGAQVVSGIGFLGAGTILVTHNNRIRGLTTAAGLWAAGCVGLAIGIGFYEGAIVVGILLLLVMTIFKRFDEKVLKHSKYVRVVLNFNVENGMLTFIEFCRNEHIKIIDMQITKSDVGTTVLFVLKNEHKCDHNELMHKIAQNEGIQFVEEI